jgi:hypothetical protein
MLDLDMKKVYFEPMEMAESILKLSQADDEKELEFELNYLVSLTFEERLNNDETEIGRDAKTNGRAWTPETF